LEGQQAVAREAREAKEVSGIQRRGSSFPREAPAPVATEGRRGRHLGKQMSTTGSLEVFLAPFSREELILPTAETAALVATATSRMEASTMETTRGSTMEIIKDSTMETLEVLTMGITKDSTMETTKGSTMEITKGSITEITKVLTMEVLTAVEAAATLQAVTAVNVTSA